jgi:hypothetical protein
MPNRYSQQPGQATAPDERQPYTPVPDDYEGDNNPYRGLQNHGVEPSGKPYEVPGFEDATPVVFEITEPEPEPVPVRIVNSETGSRQMRKWAVSALPITEGQPHQLAGRDLRRTSLILHNSGPDTVYVTPDNNAATYIAMPIGVDDTFRLETQDDVWAIVEAGSEATVIVSTEYTVEL